MVGAHLLQVIQGSFERQPFADAEVQLPLLFQLLENEEILPIAVVLHAGDAVGERIGNGQFVAAAALVVAGGAE